MHGCVYDEQEKETRGRNKRFAVSGRTVRANIGYLFTNGEPEGQNLKTDKNIQDWCREKGFDAVVWSDLGSNFKERSKHRKPFSIKTALAYLQSLDAKGKVKAAEYVWRAPDFVDTPLRRALQTAPWF